MRPATLLKKRLWHRCFSVNFEKFLCTPFLQNTSERLLLSILEFKTKIKDLQNIDLNGLTHSMPLISFDNPWKHQKARGFLFSVGIERDQLTWNGLICRWLCKIFNIYILPLTIWHQLFLEFWLVDTWFLADWHHQSAIPRLENESYLNKRREQKLGFQLSLRQRL